MTARVLITSPVACNDRRRHEPHAWEWETLAGQAFSSPCPGRDYGETDPARVVDVASDEHAPRSGQTVTGYGDKLPTRHRVRYVGADDRARWHRVYVINYGNAGSAYILADGHRLYLDTDTEGRFAS